MVGASRRLSGRCGCPWRTCPTKPMRTSDAAFGRSRAVIGTPSKHQRWRRRHEPGLPTRPEPSPTAGQVAMLVWLEQFLVRYPELALFLVIAAGYWIGTFKLGAFSLGPVTGSLFAGLLVGHLRTRYPLFGRIPDGAVALMTSLGLAAFVGLTGIHAGPIFLSALREAGLALLFGGMVVTLAPQIIGLAFGHFALRMSPILLLGAL